MLKITRLFVTLSIIVIVFAGPASADSSIATGTITGWPDAGYVFYFDDYVSVDSDIEAWWSVNTVPEGFFYAWNATTEVAHVNNITDICEVTDASAYTYDSWSVGPVTVGEFVLYHNTSTGYYAAFRVDDIYQPASKALADVTWYLQENGSDNFGPCEVFYQYLPMIMR